MFVQMADHHLIEIFEQDQVQMDRNRKRRRLNNEPTKEELDSSKAAMDAEVSALMSQMPDATTDYLAPVPTPISSRPPSDGGGSDYRDPFLSVYREDAYRDRVTAAAASSSSVVVQAAGIESEGIRAYERPFSTRAEMYFPDVGYSSTGTITTDGLGKLASITRMAGTMTRGSNMNKTDELFPIPFHCAVHSDFDDVPDGLQFAGMPPNHSATYRGWQMAKDNFHFRAHVSRTSYPTRGKETTAEHYTGQWTGDSFRTMMWAYLNFELYARRDKVREAWDFHDDYSFIGFLRTLEAGNTANEPGIGASYGSSMATFHIAGRSRTPNIWLLQEDGAGLKSHARLWLILRRVCVRDEKGDCIKKADGKLDECLQVQPWAEDVRFSTASVMPSGTLFKWPIGHLNHTEGSRCAPSQDVNRSFYPKSDTGAVAMNALNMFKSGGLPWCVVDIGVGPVMSVG